MKTTFKKSQPKIIIYCSYKYFNNESFRAELLQIEANGNNCNESFKSFASSCDVILKDTAPEKKGVRGNQSPLMNKTLSKAIMQRSRNRPEENRNNYVKQRIYVIRVCEKIKDVWCGSVFYQTKFFLIKKPLS